MIKPRATPTMEGFHLGQIAMHQRMQVPEALSAQMKSWWGSQIDESNQNFINTLPFFVLGTLDKAGKPWVSLVIHDATNSRVKAISRTRLVLQTAPSNGSDPLFRNLVEGLPAPSANDGSLMFAGLGLDYSRRARVKVHGLILPSTTKASAEGREMNLTFAMGNCPKYINARKLVFHRHSPRVLETDFLTLSDRAMKHIGQADTMFFATRHLGSPTAVRKDDATSSMDLNHRGGAPGFVRVSEDRTTLFWPDAPGNNIYSSMGNVLTDRVAGLCIPFYENGDVLQLTGTASVLFGQAADDAMPGCEVVVKFHISGLIFTEAGINLKQVGRTDFSPYNPDVSYLKYELVLLRRHPVTTSAMESGDVSLIGAKYLAEGFAAFTFSLPVPVHVVPGQYVILRFSLNDGETVVRTWTVTSWDETKQQVTCCIRLLETGLITPLLFGELDRLGETHTSRLPPIIFVGIEGEFSCFTRDGNLLADVQGKKLLWIAGGAGVTPFLAMWTGLLQSPVPMPEVSLMLSSRKDEVMVQNHFLVGNDTAYSKLASFDIFVTAAGTQEHDHIRNNVHRRRLGRADFERIPNLKDFVVYLCGPAEFMKDVRVWLDACGAVDVRMESFAF